MYIIGINKITLCGIVINEPIIEESQYGSLVRLVVKTSEKTFDKQLNRPRYIHTFHNITIFKEAAQKYTMQKIHKDLVVYLEGSIRYTKQSEPDGTQKTITSITISKEYHCIKLFVSQIDDEQRHKESAYRSEHNSVKPRLTRDDIL